MANNIIPLLQIVDHPFYTGLLNGPERNQLPISLPFALGIHPQYAISQLVATDEIRAALNSAYSLGSMASTPLGESPLALDRMTEILETLSGLLGGALEGKRLLEIGCGNGELLHQFRCRGAVVTGLEIGPQADVVEDRYGIRVLRDPLMPGKSSEKFDCIYSYGCLEHIENLDEFFLASRESLIDGGLFFHSVPNAGSSFNSVDLEHLLHEHVNYFTPGSGVALLNAQGFEAANCSTNKAGNELMLWGYYDSAISPKWPEWRMEDETRQLGLYAERFRRKSALTLDALRRMMANGMSIGFYAGGYSLGYQLGSNQIRYFDGDTFKHGKYWLPGFNKIESPAELLLNPVDKLVICRPHYFDAITDSLVALGIDRRIVLNVDSLPLMIGDV